MGTEHERKQPRKPGPVTNLVSYYPKSGKEEELLALVKKHYPALTSIGLATDVPAKLWRAYDIRANAHYIVEIFQWKDEKSSDVAHQTPEVMAIWEPMGPILEKLQITEIDPVE
jgi:hypothetical protein